MRYILVDAVVTDGEGNYIHNLRKEDFELYENGGRQEILSLDEYNMPSAVFTEQNTSGHQGQLSMPPAQPPRNIILFIDLYYSSTMGIRRAIEVTEDFVRERMQPGDNVMVAAFYNSLRIVQPFTQDKEKVIQALEDTGLTTAGYDSLMSAGESVAGSDATGGGWIQSLQERIKAADQRASQSVTKNYIASLQSLGNYLKNIRGRKTLIMLSEGFAFYLVDSSSAQHQKQLPRESILSFYNEMVEDMNESMVSVYSLNVGGLKAPGNAADSGIQSSVEQAVLEGREALSSRQDSLISIANETGGNAYMNTNNVRGMLDKVELDISNYYILGYSTDIPDESEYRSIEVKVSVPGAHVSHRQGFRTPRPFASMDAEGRDNHLIEGFSTATQLNLLEASFKPVVSQTGPETITTTVYFQLPARALTPTADDSFDLQVLVSNLNQDEEITSSVHKRYLVKNAMERTAEEQELQFSETVRFHTGVNKLRIALRDNTTGRRSYFYFFPVIKPRGPNDLVLSTPVFIAEIQQQSFAEQPQVTMEPQKKWNTQPVEGCELRSSGGTVFPVVSNQVSSSQPVELLVKLSDMAGREISTENLQMRFLASADSGLPLSQRPAFVVNPVEQQILPSEKPGQIVIRAMINFSAWKPGLYDFVIQIADPNTGRTASVVTQVTVGQ